MKKTQRKDTIRNIGKEKVSFLSIMIIAMLAVTAYLGINFGSHGLLVNADRYYARTNFRDFEITSTMLLTEEDISALKELEGVADAEGLMTVDGKAAKAEGSQKLSVVSLTERINTTELLSGRMPQRADECVLEEELFTFLPVSVGDTITVTDSHGNMPEYLSQNTFKITGSVHHADHYALETQVPGNRYVLVLPEAFDKEALDNCYMKALVRIEKPEGTSFFSKKYRKLIRAEQEKLDAFCDEKEAQRGQSVRDQADGKIADAEKELEDGRRELEDGRAEIDENTKKVEDGEKDLADGKRELADAEKKLADGEKELDDAYAELKDGKQELDDAYAELKDGKQELDDAAKKLKDAKSELEDKKTALEKSLKKLNSARSELTASGKQLAQAKADLTNSYNEVEYQKALVRNKIRKSVNESADPKAAASIRWAEPKYIKTDDVDKKSTACTDFALTDKVSMDLTKPYDTSVKKAFSDMGLSDLAFMLFKESDDYGDAEKAYDETADAGKKWGRGHEEYLQKKKDYENGLKEYNDGLARYNDGLKRYNAGLKEYRSSLAEYNDKKAEYDKNLADYESGQKELADAKEEILEKKKEIADAKAEIAEKKKEVADAEEEIADGKKKLEEGEADYADSLDKISKGEADLAAAKEDAAALGDCHYVLLPPRGNGSYTHAQNSAENVGKLGMTFAFLFVLIAALVIYATVGRIIGEQRPLVGTQKALGLFGSEVFRKYLAFGETASLAGILLGIAVGYGFVQHMVLVSHEQFYVTGVIPRIFRYGLAAVVLAAGMIVAAVSVLWACSRLLREPARSLMQEPPPQGRNRAETGEKKGSLYSRLIVRNMLTDWQRVLITIVSVAGCCVLLVIGFSLRDSIYNSIDRQFEEIFFFDDRVTYDEETAENAGEEIGKVIDGLGSEKANILFTRRSFTTPDGLSTSELACIDAEEAGKYFCMHTVDGKTLMQMDDSGIYLTRGFSEFYEFKEGDPFTIYDTSMNPHETRVAGVFEYYYGTIMLMSKECYRNVFGEDCEENAYWVRRSVSDEELTRAVSAVPGFEAVDSKDSIRARYLKNVSVLTVITVMLIVAAGMMAFFVLLNLVNMYLTKKHRELTIMRINGFTTREVIRYAAGESVVTTVLGILLGLAAGAGFAYVIIRFIEQPQLGLMRTVDLKGWLVSALFTAFFSTVINAIAFRKVKDLKLSDMSQ